MISFVDKIISAHQCQSVGINNFVHISEYSWIKKIKYAPNRGQDKDILDDIAF